MFNRFVQIGVVVADLEKVTRNLTQVFGIGPFRIIDWPPAGRDYVERIYHGQPANFTARMAFAELGSIELEIIQPLDGPSIWADFLRNQGGGIHHIRFNVEQVEPVQAYLAQHSVLAAQQGSGIRPGTEWMNFASEKLVGFVIEVMKVAPGTDGRTPQIVDGKVVEGP
ncbi:MAG: VOC family protein [Chloroflexi bacterium]|nr:VOC family protein [Chloroflexota bacterium]